MRERKKDIKTVAAAVLTHINMGKIVFTADELDEQLPLDRATIAQTLGRMAGEGLFTVSEKGDVYTVAADIGDFRDYYLAIDKQTPATGPRDALGTIRMPDRVAQMCGFGQWRKNRRLPSFTDAEAPARLDDIDLDALLDDIDEKDFDRLFNSVFGDDDGE